MLTIKDQVCTRERPKKEKKEARRLPPGNKKESRVYYKENYNKMQKKRVSLSHI